MSTLSDATTYDFVIVGGGTAGLALACRLTECGDQTVLVLEAGSSPAQVASYRAPGADPQTRGSVLDWAFITPPQSTLNNRTLLYNRGRCLGGSSSISGLTYGRGSSSIYDNWEGLGNPGWSWKDVFPYFRKSTTFNPPKDSAITSYADHDPDAYSDGPLQLGYGGYTQPGTLAFVESLAAIGVQPAKDLNTYERSSAFDNYYGMAKDRANLNVQAGASVQQILFSDDLTATGVMYLDQKAGELINVTASKEVIMCAGSFQTPQMLMLSGIGPKAELDRVGIAVKLDSPNMGQNMQDHFYFSLNIMADESTSLDPLYNDIFKMQNAQKQYNQHRQGPLTSPSAPAFGFQRLDTGILRSLGAVDLLARRTDQAHIEYFYEPFFYPLLPPVQYSPIADKSYITITAGLMAPASRGNVTLRSASPVDFPILNLNYLEKESDQRMAVHAFRNLRKLLSESKAFQPHTIGPDYGEVAPGKSVQTDKDILEYIKNTATTVWHACGTCRMLPEADGGVVDPRLRLYGVKKLRIVDASIMPIVPDQHIQAAVYMIAEKAADMIKEDWGF